MKIGIFIPNWIGDAAMATPTLRALRKHFGPDAELTGIMRPYVADVLAGTRWLDSQLLYYPKSPQTVQRTRSVLAELRRLRPDAMILLTNSLRAAMLAWASGAKQRIGYVRYGRGPLLTHKLFFPRHGRRYLPAPAIDAYLQLAYAAGCAWERPALELATLPEDEAAADAVWKKWKLPLASQVVILNSGGAYGAAKLWPSEYFAQLARRIVGEQGYSVLITCGPTERDVAREIVNFASDPRVVSLADEAVSIGLSKACIRRSRLLVTTDSGPRFFAVAFGVPLITLFGPTDPRWTSTHDEREICLQHLVPCGPCARRTCPLAHHDCMRKLSVDQAYAAVLEQLKSRQVRAA